MMNTDWLLIADELVLNQEQTRLPAARKGLLLLRELGARVEERLKGADWWAWTVTSPFRRQPGKPCLGYEPQWANGALLRTGNTGTYAVEAAALMGYTDIRLLGIDMRFDLARSHFYGQNKYQGVRISYNKRHLKNVVGAFEALRMRLNGMGIALINESAYEGPLDAVLPREKSEWTKK